MSCSVTHTQTLECEDRERIHIYMYICIYVLATLERILPGGHIYILRVCKPHQKYSVYNQSGQLVSAQGTEIESTN